MFALAMCGTRSASFPTGVKDVVASFVLLPPHALSVSLKLLVFPGEEGGMSTADPHSIDVTAQ
jgi:hypothetical protein